MTETAQLTWSTEQLLIHEEFRTGQGNCIIVAYAGTGKTTTGVQGVQYAPERSILYCAFNKKNSVELDTKFKAAGVRNVASKTLHSVGCAAVMRNWEGIGIDFEGDREKDLTNAVAPTAPDAIKRLISKLHTKAREITPHARKLGELTDLACQFECEPDAQWEEDGYTLDFIENAALKAMERAATIKPLAIDGADMIFLPLRNGWLRKSYDMVVVDEYQDLTAAMLEMAQKVCRGRLFIVGDPNQAIYAFRGADSDSASRLRRELGAKELGLTVTRRCGKTIVELAAKLVPGFTAHEDNGEGTISNVSIEKIVEEVGPGDAFLSRANAPLVPVAMRLLRAGKRCRIAGRDIGKGLVALVRKLKARSVPDFLTKVNAWQEREITRLTAQYAGKLESDTYKHRIDGVKDQAAMLCDLSDGAKNVEQIMSRIEELFTDDGTGDAGLTVLSSVHKAKGLEWNKVFILKETLRDYNQEELNIQYVAITRARKELVWVV